MTDNVKIDPRHALQNPNSSWVNYGHAGNYTGLGKLFAKRGKNRCKYK